MNSVSSWKWYGIASVAALVAVVTLTACSGGASAPPGRSTQAVSQAATTGPVAEMPTATPTTAALVTPGAQQGSSDVCGQPMSVQSRLPASVPQYPGSQLRVAQSSGGNGLFGLCTTDSVAAAAQFYATQLPAKGWQKVQRNANGAVQQVSATQSQGQIFITIEPDPTISGQTEIIILTGGVS